MKFYFLGNMPQIWEAGIKNLGQKVSCARAPPPPPPPPPTGKIGEGKGIRAQAN